MTPIGIELSVRRNDVANPPVEALDDELEAIGFKILKRALYPALDEALNVRILVGANPESRG